jgi:multidrug resistance protein, MATE family
MLFFSRYYKDVLYLAIPVVLSYAIESLIIFINTYFAAKMGHESLGAIALASSSYRVIIGFCWGVITAVGIMIAKMIGGRNISNIALVLKSGILVSFVLGLLAVIIMNNFTIIWNFFGLDPNLITLADNYVSWCSIGIIPDITKYAFLQYAISFHRTNITVVSSVALIFLVALFNYLLVNGCWFFPNMGIAGIGFGNAIALWIVAISTYIYISLDYELGSLLKHRYKLLEIFSKAKKIIIIGAPIGVIFSLEISFLMMVGIMIAKIDNQALAAYQIATQWEWLFEVFVFGFTEAVIILVSKAYGAKQYNLIKFYYKDALLFSLIFSIIGVLTLIIFADFFISIDLNPYAIDNLQIVAYTKQIFIFCLFIRILESFRITTTSVLRALSMSNYPMYVTLIMFWIIGMPLCYLLSFQMNLGINGVFYGLIFVLFSSAIIVYSKMTYELKKLADIDL